MNGARFSYSHTVYIQIPRGHPVVGPSYWQQQFKQSSCSMWGKLACIIIRMILLGQEKVGRFVHAGGSARDFFFVPGEGWSLTFPVCVR